jgi:hypothetical protein
MASSGQVLAGKRRRNEQLPIFVCGDQLTVESLPSSILGHANAFMRLFEDSFEFMAHDEVRPGIGSLCCGSMRLARWTYRDSEQRDR